MMELRKLRNSKTLGGTRKGQKYERNFRRRTCNTKRETLDVRGHVFKECKLKAEEE